MRKVGDICAAFHKGDFGELGDICVAFDKEDFGVMNYKQ